MYIILCMFCFTPFHFRQLIIEIHGNFWIAQQVMLRYYSLHDNIIMVGGVPWWVLFMNHVT